MTDQFVINKTIIKDQKNHANDKQAYANLHRPCCGSQFYDDNSMIKF